LPETVAPPLTALAPDARRLGALRAAALEGAREPSFRWVAIFARLVTGMTMGIERRAAGVGQGPRLATQPAELSGGFLTLAWRGQGTRVQYGLMASGAVDTDYHSIEECRITNDQDRSNELDASKHDPPRRFMEYVSGMRDVAWNIGGNWLPQRQSHQDVY